MRCDIFSDGQDNIAIIWYIKLKAGESYLFHRLHGANTRAIGIFLRIKINGGGFSCEIQAGARKSLWLSILVYMRQGLR